MPEPDTLSAEHSARVAAHLREYMGGGDITFADFLNQVLYMPGLGYYAAGATKFGAAGDFVTSPEVSSLFGNVVARQIAEVLASVEGGSIVEYGAGSGKLAVDILRALQKLDALPVRYQILEISADLEERQQNLLREAVPDLIDRVEWLTSLPRNFRGVMIGNEVLDAMPFERFTIAGDAVMQMGVAAKGDDFTWTTRPAPDWLEGIVRFIEGNLGKSFPDGYRSEVSVLAHDWVHNRGTALEEGVILLFDYGVSRREYYAAERSDGWLRCHFRHHAHNDPLILPGIQDITAWVDFTLVAEAAQRAGLDILGYTAQAPFLLGGGLEEEMAAFTELPVEQQLQLSGQVKTLTLPGEMGENFKCIALGRG
ncbi:MAG: SAM-dependent methyltransferase, partial [Pseudomonadota bacterium]